MNLREKITNALYAQAVVDAVGNPFEFKTKIGKQSVIDYANSAKKLVQSDDSQMMEFGFEALHNIELYDGDIFEQVRKSFTQSYVDWYYTQTHEKNNLHLYANGLLEYHSMYSVQAPGNTCMNACYELKNHKLVKNDSMGCGSVMRLLPLVSLLDTYTFPGVNNLAKITGNITHKHINNDAAITQYMVAASRIIRGIDVDCPEAIYIAELGDGWIASEAVNMAVWAYCKAESFDDLMALSIAHDGDSDSVGAIAGSLWGLSGREVPQKYIDKLDALDAINYVISIIK